MKLNLELKESGMPTECGFYVCEHKEVDIKSIVEIRLHPEDKVPVIFQFGTGRSFTQSEQDKGFFWSERIEL